MKIDFDKLKMLSVLYSCDLKIYYETDHITFLGTNEDFLFVINNDTYEEIMRDVIVKRECEGLYLNKNLYTEIKITLKIISTTYLMVKRIC